MDDVCSDDDAQVSNALVSNNEQGLTQTAVDAHSSANSEDYSRVIVKAFGRIDRVEKAEVSKIILRSVKKLFF